MDPPSRNGCGMWMNMRKGEKAIDPGVLESTVNQVHHDPLTPESCHDDIRGRIGKPEI